MSERTRLNLERDRLSSLSDDLILKVLSFVSTKHAVQTSVLSSRWRFIWTSVPSLSLSSDDFCSLLKFFDFVKHVLLERNHQIEVSSVELRFRKKEISLTFIERVLDYALSHKVKQLNFTSLSFPLFRFSSQSLEHLTLTECVYRDRIAAQRTWNLPSLTTLSLHHVKFYAEYNNKCASLFSNCVNLKNLTFKRCRMMSINAFNISHPGLTSLTFEDGCKHVNLDTPQLKNLTIKHWQGIRLICAPILSTLRYEDPCSVNRDPISIYDNDPVDDDGLLQLSTVLHHLEKVELCIRHLHGDKAYIHKLTCLLQQLHSVKFLTLNLEIIKLLSSSMVPSPFTNLESVKIFRDFLEGPKVIISSKVKNYLLERSPNATFMIVLNQLDSMKNSSRSNVFYNELATLSPTSSSSSSS